ncbi:LysR family transcriptional regulator [Mesorhizobium sp.]|uniref:LysR family transcriptional regulator n=1 Tax=Mesorhizobium sp. TaxID=1871066 RepID=UPI000FEA3CC6|nr:LysR family transcriptional regulator [Mesorhizobium sp.]RWG07768.1 MAG: LysR family transcriptional regulator [Mesorhizobium sp.]RWH02920.1 MAG: LysR family transcriptional regulator [Mesorhizobium sp.]TIN48922.1 MAG: LysR family transcriptional regulator [Mesorhizobium sp.]TIR95629.1 MAG: LysR family transcriptional regulator [Mesorhizobium sp.]TIS04742.1 MAG: LysR family transcriptional regulator [Mesorhizobium sp.]
MQSHDRLPPLNSIRVFLAVAREGSVTNGAASLGITQSGASRHIAALEAYLGGQLFHRRGREIELTEIGRLYSQETQDALDTIEFTSRRMRQKDDTPNSLVVRTSLPTFAYATLIPKLPNFTASHSSFVDVVTSLATPKPTDAFDVLVTRDLEYRGASERWLLVEEQLVCVGPPALIERRSVGDLLKSKPVISVSSRPDILPRWTRAMDMSLGRIRTGPRYDHHFLAIPAATTGQGLLIVPEILVIDLIAQGLLAIAEGSRAKSGMQYSAYSVDKGRKLDLGQSFCRWLVKMCRTQERKDDRTKVLPER